MVKKPRPLPTQNPTGLLTYIPLLRSMDAVYRERSTGSRPSVPCSAENASLNFQSDPHAAQLHSRALFGKSLPAQLCSVSQKQPNYCQPTKKNIILFSGHHVSCRRRFAKYLLLVVREKSNPIWSTWWLLASSSAPVCKTHCL